MQVRCWNFPQILENFHMLNFGKLRQVLIKRINYFAISLEEFKSFELPYSSIIEVFTSKCLVSVMKCIFLYCHWIEKNTMQHRTLLRIMISSSCHWKVAIVLIFDQEQECKLGIRTQVLRFFLGRCLNKILNWIEFGWEFFELNNFFRAFWLLNLIWIFWISRGHHF